MPLAKEHSRRELLPNSFNQFADHKLRLVFMVCLQTQRKGNELLLSIFNYALEIHLSLEAMHINDPIPDCIFLHLHLHILILYK